MGTPPPIELANLGMADSLILMVLALVVFGPRRLPQIGRQIGKLMYEFRKASNDFKYQMEEELRLSEEADRRKKEEAERLRIAALVAPAPAIEAQTLESQTDIGAAESAAAASPYPGESHYPEQYPPELAESSQPVTIPRLQPPTVGEQVSADKPNSILPPALLPGDSGAESAEPAAATTATEPAAGPAAGPASDLATPGTEPVNQHG